MNNSRRLPIWLILLGFVAVPCLAQVDTGGILGTVRDPSGGVLPGATVTLTHKQTGVVTRATTDSRGNYEAVGLPIGTYNVLVSLQGFRTATRENVDVRIQDRLRINFSLEVGGATEAVVVTTEAPILQTQEGSLGQVIETKQIQELPVSGRSFIPLAALAPGAFQLGGETNGNAGEEDTLIVNGMRASSVNYLLDGVDNNNNDSPGHPIIEPNLDAIAEFKAQTSNYSAEFGRSGGAVINMTIKAGTNDTKGTAFVFGHEGALDSRDYFADPNEPKPPFPLLPVRRNDRRTRSAPGKGVFLRRFSGNEPDALGHADLLGADRSERNGRLLRRRQSDPHRSADRRAFPGQRRPGGSDVASRAQFHRPLSEPQRERAAQQLRRLANGHAEYLSGRSAFRRQRHRQRPGLRPRLVRPARARDTGPAAGDRRRRRLWDRRHERGRPGARPPAIRRRSRNAPSTSCASDSTSCRRASAFRSGAPSSRRPASRFPASRWIRGSTA